MRIGRTKETIAWVCVGILALLVIACSTVYFQDPLFWKRYYLVMKTGGTLPQSGWAGSEFKVVGNHQSFLPLLGRERASIPEAVLNEVTDYAETHNSSSLLIWHDGQLVLREHFDDFNPDSLIVGKSMAKMVASIVIARAIEQGYIDGLDQSASDFIGEWRGSPREAITIRHMLHMSAGFEQFYTEDLGPFSNFARSYLAGYNEDVLINGYELIHTPGEHYDYSQVVSDLLAVVVERATGIPYGRYLSESLIQPLGAQGGEVMMNRPDGLAHAGCCLLLPSESWLRIGIFLLNNGVTPDGKNLLPEGWMQEYLEPSPANPAMGLHIWLAEPYFERRAWAEAGAATGFGVLHSEPYLDPDLFLFDGSGNQVMYIIPSERIVILRTGAFSFGVKPEWDNTFLPNRILRAVRNP